MTEQDVLDILRGVGAIITDDHIVYTSGKHGSAYVNKDAVYPYTDKISRLCEEIAKHFLDTGVEVVVGPEKGAIILSQWVAHHLSRLTGREILAVYAEKAESGFVIKRGYDKLIRGKKTLIVEDILTTGGSARKVIETARGIGCDIIGLGVICNRGGIKPENVGDVPQLFALLNIELTTYEEADCPLCKEGIPINTDVGKGREFLARKAK